MGSIQQYCFTILVAMSVSHVLLSNISLHQDLGLTTVAVPPRHVDFLDGRRCTYSICTALFTDTADIKLPTCNSMSFPTLVKTPPYNNDVCVCLCIYHSGRFPVQYALL